MTVQVFKQCGFIVKEIRYQTDLPAVKTCLTLKMWYIVEHKIPDLKFYIKQEGEGISL